MEIIEACLDQCGPAMERQLAIIDKNRDVYIAKVRRSEASFIKLGIAEYKMNQTIKHFISVLYLNYCDELVNKCDIATFIYRHDGIFSRME